MCGRLDQNHSAAEYVAALRWARQTPVIVDSEAAGSYNAAPGSYRPLVHVAGGQLLAEDLYWGYRARWAAGKVPVAINARAEKLGNRYWRPLLIHGRAIVPADGWYEWTGPQGQRQPWHIHHVSGAPLFIAALANFGPFKEERCEAGFVLVTQEAEGGLLDVHDRRPVVFTAEDAALWLDPDLPPEQAEHLARTAALPPSEFGWHPVSREMGRAGIDGARIAAPIDLPPDACTPRAGPDLPAGEDPADGSGAEDPPAPHPSLF